MLKKILSAGLNRKTAKVELDLGYPALIVPFNSSHKIFRRKGYGAFRGVDMHEVILIDKDGNVAPETPVMWDYNNIDYIKVIRADVKPITVKGGKITTLACNTDCVVRDEAGNPIKVYVPYIRRGILVNRSYTTLSGVEHYVTDEISVTRQKNGEIGAPYYGFYASSYATDVTFEDCVMTGRRCYKKSWAGNFSGMQGTYDLTANNVNKIIFKNCTQSNFWVTLDENDVLHPAKEGDKGALLALSQMLNDKGDSSRMHWGIGGTNFCKNMEYIGCTLSRFDAHDGLYNGKIIDSTVVDMALTGAGDVLIENTRVFAESHAESFNRMFSMRADYGSTREGNITVKGLKAYVYTKPSSLQNAVNSEYAGIYVVYHRYTNWYYGYECYFPNISLDSLEVYDIETGMPVPEGTEIHFISGNMKSEPALHREKTLRMRPFFPGVDDDGDGLIDGTNIPFENIIRGGVADESSDKNLNPTVPPKYIKILNNKGKYVFLVNDMSSFDGVTDGGFFGKTKFISDNETCVGTNYSDVETESFKFVKFVKE